MNIGILHSGDLNSISPGGVSQYIEKLIINNKKDKIFLFGTCDKDSNMVLFNEYRMNIDENEYIFIPISNNKKTPLSIYYFINMFRLYLKDKKLLEKIDVLYAQRMEYVLPFKFIFKKKKVVMAVHGSGKYAYIFWGKLIGTIYNFIEKISVKRSDKVVVLLNREEYGVPYYKKKYRKHSEKIVYGKVPIDLTIFKKIEKDYIRKKYEISCDSKVIVYCGRVEDNPKRVLLFTDIANKLQEDINDLTWVVIGSGNDLDKLKIDVQEKKLDKVFKFIGHVKHGSELTELINCADVSILISSFEGICMSALESIACGVPVVATDVGDVNEYIRGNINGLILDNKNNEQIILDSYKNIKSILTSDKYVKIDRIVDKYSSDIVHKELLDILENS